jgi:hypothetical protein
MWYVEPSGRMWFLATWRACDTAICIHVVAGSASMRKSDTGPTCLAPHTSMWMFIIKSAAHDHHSSI